MKKYRIVLSNGFVVKDEKHKIVYDPPSKKSRAACRAWIKNKTKGNK